MSIDALQDLTIQALNITLMLSVGLALDLTVVRATTRRFGLLTIATLLNFALLPAIAVGAVRVFRLETAVAAGVLLSAFAPGGGTGTLLTRTARGNLELSVVLLALFTLLAVPLTPALALATLGTVEGAELRLQPMLRTLVVFQLIPLVLGVAMRRFRPGWADATNRLARPLSNAIFALLFVGLLVTKGHLVFQAESNLIAVITLLVVSSLAIPSVWHTSRRDCSALSLTTGVRNLSLALLLSSTFFDDVTTIVVLAYGLAMYALGVPMALWWRRSTVDPQGDASTRLHG